MTAQNSVEEHLCVLRYVIGTPSVDNICKVQHTFP
jgi:hypothetical protein